MAQNSKNGPQSRAPLKWGEGAKNLTASRHQGCLINVPSREVECWKTSGGDGRQCGLQVNVGTWNVRTLRTKGKLENVKQEMRRMKINVLGLSEIRWDDEVDFVMMISNLSIPAIKEDRREWH